MMSFNFSPYEIGVGVAAMLGGIGMILNKLGLLVVGRKQEECPDPGCQSNVKNIAQKVDKIEETQGKQWEKLNEIGEHVSFIRGSLARGGKE